MGGASPRREMAASSFFGVEVRRLLIARPKTAEVIGFVPDFRIANSSSIVSSGGEEDRKTLTGDWNEEGRVLVVESSRTPAGEQQQKGLRVYSNVSLILIFS